MTRLAPAAVLAMRVYRSGDCDDRNNVMTTQPGGGENSTDVSNAFNQVLDEVDDIARATPGAITLTTLIKLIERNRSRQINAGPPADPVEA
jgi:hypothetical protein